MKILALEFSSVRRSVAVGEKTAAGTANILARASEIGGRSVKALTMIDSALREAGLRRGDIDCIAVGLGPGSYAGIRAAIALAQGWQLAREIKLLGISSVECMAVEATNRNFSGEVTFAIDAQRGEFYVAKYQISGGLKKAPAILEPLQIVTIDDIESRLRRGETILSPQADEWFKGKAQLLFPEATALATLAAGRDDFVSGERMEPIYLRESAFVKAPPPRLSAT